MSAEITLELGENIDPVVCDCCGSPIHRVYGFVYRSGDAYSMYHASWLPAHAARGANVALQFGDWSQAAGPADRYRVGLEIRTTSDEYQFAFLNPEDSAWRESNEVQMLRRDEALAHPDRNEFLHVAELVLFGDSRLKAEVDGVAA
jgi:hypothetical protein